MELPAGVIATTRTKMKMTVIMTSGKDDGRRCHTCPTSCPQIIDPKARTGASSIGISQACAQTVRSTCLGGHSFRASRRFGFTGLGLCKLVSI